MKLIKKIITGLFSFSLLFTNFKSTCNTISNNDNSIEQIDTIENVEDLIDASLDDVNSKINDYIDFEFFSSFEYKENNNFSLSTLSTNNIEGLKYTETKKIVGKIFSQLSDEEYQIIKDFSNENEEINDMLNLMDNNFSYNEINCIYIKKSAIAALSATLSGIGLSSASATIIKGSFYTTLNTIKAFFIPTPIKIILITSAILVLTSVIVINWNIIKTNFNNIVYIFSSVAGRFVSTIVKVFNNIYKISNENNSNVSKNPTSANQLQKQVERKQAPKEVDRVDNSHSNNGQPHVHFKDGTSINQDGSIHDKHNGTPKLSNKVKEWLNKNGWCLNGLRN